MNITESSHDLNGRMPLGKALPLGLQHVLAMFVANITPIIILANVADIPNELSVNLIQNAMIIAGIGTVIQLYPVWRIGSGLPIVMGISFTFLSVAISIALDFSMGTLIGAVIIGGIIEGLLGLFAKYWIKIKPEVDTIDLAVIGAEWGEGKRAKVFGSFLLACQDENGELLEISRVATGIDDAMLANLYEIFKEKIIAEKGKSVVFEPDVVFEVGYAELQRSVNYAAGFALRFPRFVRLREDKDASDIETMESLQRRYSMQNKEE